MPMNHFSSDISETIWWTPQAPLPPFKMEPTPETPSSDHHLLSSPPSSHTTTPSWPNSQFHHNPYHHHSTATTSMFCGENPGFSFNLNQEDDEESLHEHERDNGKFQEQLREEEADKEPMFEKPLTPSDVGKLNRLVIPKQHAEKYFPLSGSSGGDSGGGGGGEKGLLLSFEDESGKCWRFRYSYWNSSQSYVLTKGWSRFVKEKRLDAGDVVLFERHRVNGDRLFIGWRRRPTPNAASTAVAVTATGQHNRVAQTVTATGGGGGWTQVFYSYPPITHGPPPPPPIPYQPDHCLHSGAVVQQNPTTTPSGNSKRLRLFGVNLEYCQPDESEPSTPDGSSQSSQGQAHYHQYCTINPNDHASSTNQQTSHDMDINFSRNVNQMRYHQG